MQDSNAQTVNYTYDTLRRPVKVTTTTEGKEYKNEYTYDAAKGHLTQVKHNTSANAAEDVAYNFGYDGLGRPTTVAVGTQNLSTNAYNATGTLASTTFGNGGKVVNEYDAWNRITGIKYDSDTAARYTYAYNANGQVAQVRDTTLNRVTETEYDLANRPCRKKTHDGASHVYTGELSYDPVTGNLSKYAERTGTGYTAYETTFGYDEENRPTTLTYGGYGSTTSAFDKLGRVTTRGLMVGSGSVKNATYTYVAGGHGTNSTTGLVQTITQFGTTLTYAYDNVGNITSVGDGSKTVSYNYDKLGQLIRANDPYDTTAGSTGTTWVYTYDQGGNILSKTAYAYTTGTVGTVVKTDSYTYGDTNWKDKLTAYNGANISYDAIGNPTSDGTWTYTWEKGRQLKSMSKAGETATFTYNADGLRVKKVCTTTGTTNYTLHGKNVVHLNNGSNNLHFFYDALNRPAVVVFNGTAYGYVHNLQGDIVAIVNSAGTKVVEYAYDAWGKPLSKAGTLASTLGTLNPFRYRGYVFDEETGLYYLRSRYYNSIWNRFSNSDTLIKTDGKLFGSSTFIYCSNKPLSHIDNDGFADYECYDEDGLPGNLGEACGSPNIGGSNVQYHSPNGGGGITTNIQIGNVKISFGHGGRHMSFDQNLGLIENAIAQDIISNQIVSMTLHQASKHYMTYGGSQLEYRTYMMESNHVYVGTYFFPLAK